VLWSAWAQDQGLAALGEALKLIGGVGLGGSWGLSPLAPVGSRGGIVSPWLGSPTSDVDLTTNTDSEDLAIFALDALELVEQDHALLADLLLEGGMGVGVAALAMGALRRRSLAASQGRRGRGF
jgi:hypothetical protein